MIMMIMIVIVIIIIIAIIIMLNCIKTIIILIIIIRNDAHVISSPRGRTPWGSTRGNPLSLGRGKFVALLYLESKGVGEFRFL